MSRAALIVFANALAWSCTQDVQVVLAPADGCDSPCGRADMSCVRYLGVVALGDTPDEFTTVCATIEEGSLRSLCSHDLADRLDLALPENVESIELQGFSSERGCGGYTMFGGYAALDGDADIRVDVQCNLDCSTLSARDYQLRLVDLGALASEARCRAPDDVHRFDVAVGVTQDFRRYMARPELNVVFEPFRDVRMTAPPSADGQVGLYGESFDVSDVRGRCLSVDTYAGTGWTTSCINGGPPARACGTGSALEVTWVSRSTSLRFETLLASLGHSDWYYAGVVWDPRTAAPIAGAVVDGLPDVASVVYVDATGPVFAQRSSRMTGRSGTFVVIGDMVGPMTVTAPGYKPRDQVIAVTSHGPSSGLIPLDRATTYASTPRDSPQPEPAD